MNVKVGMLEGGVIPPFLHRSASWNLNAREDKKDGGVWYEAFEEGLRGWGRV